MYFLGGYAVQLGWCIFLEDMKRDTGYEESVDDKFKSNLLLMLFWLHIINYNS